MFKIWFLQDHQQYFSLLYLILKILTKSLIINSPLDPPFYWPGHKIIFKTFEYMYINESGHDVQAFTKYFDIFLPWLSFIHPQLVFSWCRGLLLRITIYIYAHFGSASDQVRITWVADVTCPEPVPKMVSILFLCHVVVRVLSVPSIPYGAPGKPFPPTFVTGSRSQVSAPVAYPTI